MKISRRERLLSINRQSKTLLKLAIEDGDQELFDGWEKCDTVNTMETALQILGTHRLNAEGTVLLTLVLQLSKTYLKWYKTGRYKAVQS